jgi:conjugal transfer pilus assembly protein TraB
MISSRLKGRRGKVLGIGLVLLGIIIVIALLTSGEEEEARKREQEKTRVLKTADLEKEKWRASSEKEIDKLKKSQKELLKEIKSLKDQLSAKEEKESSPPLPPLTPGKNVFSPPPPPPPPTFENGKGTLEKLPSQIRMFSPETASIVSGQAQISPQKEEATLGKGNWIPSGSFVKGILLSGLDAPTGVQARSNPYPVLIRLSEPANLPNLRRLDVKECFATGGGYGDLASERAYIRLETISCVLKSGKVIDTQVKGYVAGEDGKVGIRGRLISKQGQFLSRALLAGFASGIGQAFSSFSTVTSIGAGGTVTVGPDELKDIGVVAAGGGVSKAAEKLADYYLKLADEVFPVVEIDSGRTVDVVVLEGKELTPRGRLISGEAKDTIPDDITNSEPWEIDISSFSNLPSENLPASTSSDLKPKKLGVFRKGDINKKPEEEKSKERGFLEKNKPKEQRNLELEILKKLEEGKR